MNHGACGGSRIDREVSPDRDGGGGPPGDRVEEPQGGLTVAEMVESLLAMWAAGGERAEGLDQFRQDEALALLLGHDMPAASTTRDFLAQFHAEDLPLLQDGKSSVTLPIQPGCWAWPRPMPTSSSISSAGGWLRRQAST